MDVKGFPSGMLTYQNDDKPIVIHAPKVSINDMPRTMAECESLLRNSLPKRSPEIIMTKDQMAELQNIINVEPFSQIIHRSTKIQTDRLMEKMKNKLKGL